MSGRKKRFWTDSDKRGICRQASMPGTSVAQVGRRYAVNANLIHKWLRDPRFRPSLGVDIDEEVLNAGTFLPVEIDALPSYDGKIIEAPAAVAHSPVSANRVDITLSDGRRILIEGPTTLSAVSSLVQGLMA